MKIALYSDLHLEFGTDFKPETDADVMILAGDIITFKDFKPLGKFLEGWTKPVLYLAGNHEYYTTEPIEEGRLKLQVFLNEYNFPNIKFLDNEAITIQGINFFGGTMWTDYRNYDPIAMSIAHNSMNDYRLIRNGDRKLLPSDTIEFHELYKQKLIEWFETTLEGKRIVLTHHAPCTNPNDFHKRSNLQPAYNSLDMIPIIMKYKPALWCYGHTHESDDQIIGETRIISNPRGYPLRNGGGECKEFYKNGMEIII